MADKDVIAAWQPRLIRQTINNTQGELITHERWNELWNLNINQGDDAAVALKATTGALLTDIADLVAHKISSDHDSRYYTEQEIDSKLLILNNTVNADVAALATHKNSTDHDVRYFTKTQLSAAGQATVDWNNVTNKPNFADATWKTAVANKATLPLAGNQLGDQRMVLDDGDGKSALYTCVATSGTVTQQWNKIGDVDWSSEEATRITQENERKSAETIRVSNEATRVTAETNRLNAEAIRNTAHANAVLAESNRASAEVVRRDNETARVSAENTRVTSENARLSAEAARVSAEPLRISNENTRVSNESSRAAAEVIRSNNELARVSAEDARNSNESLRINAENTRVQEFNTIKSEWGSIVSADITAEVVQARATYPSLKGRLDAADTTIASKLNRTATNGYFMVGNASNIAVPTSAADVKTLLSITNVNNTSDLAKPISTAVQSALNGKLNSDAKAADSDKLDGLNSTQFARADDIPVFTGGAGAGNGGRILLGKSPTGSSQSGDTAVDVYTNFFRVYEHGATTRGIYLDITECANGAASKLFHSGNYGAIIHKTGNVTVDLTYCDRVVSMGGDTIQYVTLNPSAIVGIPLGTQITFLRNNIGDVEFVTANGASIVSAGSRLKIAEQYGGVTAIKLNDTTWQLVGATKA